MKGEHLDNAVRELVANGNLWEAIKLGMKYFPKNNTITQLAWRYKSLERQNNAGLVYWEQYTEEQNRIVLALLSLLTSVESEVHYRKNRAWRVKVMWIIIIAPFLNYSRIYGTLASTFFILFVSVMSFAKILTYIDPPPGQPGILVRFGSLDQGQGSQESASSPSNLSTPALAAAATPPPVEAVSSEPEETTNNEPDLPIPTSVAEPAATPSALVPKAPSEYLVIDDRSNELALKKKKEEEKKREEEHQKRAEELAEKKKKDAEAKKKADADRKKKEAAEAKRRADAAAAARAAKEAEADRLKEEIRGEFNGSDNEAGDTEKPGHQGDPNGDPNAGDLEGISTGSGMVGGGLGNRGGNGPGISDKSQAIGRIVVKVCVNSEGRVISAKYTQSGSTTSNSQLRRIAEKNAKKWRFKRAELDSQCGTITYEFKIK